MKIGLSSWSFPWAITAGATLYDLAETSARLGAEVFQIADNSGFLTQDKGAQIDILRHFSKCGLEVELGANELSKSVLRPLIELCARQNVKLLRTLPHKGGGKMTFSEAENTLKKLEPQLRETGVVLGIENHDFYKSEWLKELMKSVGSPNVGICFDAANNFGQGESFYEVFENLKDYTVNFHCKDFVIRRKKSKLGFEVSGCAAGDGMLDFSLAKQKFGEVSWIVELWTDEENELGATVKTEYERAKRSVEFLKKFREENFSNT